MTAPMCFIGALAANFVAVALRLQQGCDCGIAAQCTSLVKPIARLATG